MKTTSTAKYKRGNARAAAKIPRAFAKAVYPTDGNTAVAVRSFPAVRAAAGAAGKAGAVQAVVSPGRLGARAAAFGSAKIVRMGPEVVKGRRILTADPESREGGILQALRTGFTPQGVLAALMAAVLFAAAGILMRFNLERAVIYGTSLYTGEQIEAFVTRGTLGSNTFMMALKYHHKTVTDIPFIDQIDIDLVSPSTVRVNIKEKPPDGCICRDGKYIYLSKEGLVQTVSLRGIEGVTLINGVELARSKSGTKALAKNQAGIELSLELLRALDKYGIRSEADSITVDEKNSLTVCFGDIEVRVGRSGYDGKMYKLHQILPHLKGRSGTILLTGLDDYSHSDVVLLPEKQS